MSLEKTEAVLLKSFNWSESSRTVVFFSRRFGKLALVDRGGRSLKSRRGRLLPFARMEITFYHSEKETRGYISDIDLVRAWSFESDGSLGRLAYGSAACELCHLLLPEEEPLPRLYDFFTTFLEYVEAVDKRSLAGVFIAFFLRLLSQLGYHPSLTDCSVCGRPIEPNGSVAMSEERGGAVCPSCQSPADYYIHLSANCFAHLAALQEASLKEAALRAISFRQTSQILEVLTRLLASQAGVKGDLKSLEFLHKLKNGNG